MRKTKVYKKSNNKWLMLPFMVFLYLFIGLIFLVNSKPQAESIDIFSETLPVIIIDTRGADINKIPDIKEVEVDGLIKREVANSERHKVNLSLYLTDPNKTTADIKPHLSSETVMNIRGQSSLYYPKKQFTIRLVDENGYENHQEMIGMPKHDKWVLNGMYSDKTMLRNYLAYKMGRQTMEYAPNTRYVEVYVKQSENQSIEDQYQGIYILTEKIERDLNRINISSNDDKNMDTSFIMARDKVKLNDEVFESDWNKLEEEYIIIPKNTVKARTVFSVTYPSQSNLTNKNRSDILKTLNDFEYALNSNNFKHRQEGYNKHIDIDSFVKFAMIQEITKNIDGGEVSSYFYKDIGEKIKAGPVWDFDMSMKNTPDNDFNEPTGFTMLDTIWYDRLFQDEYFANLYQIVYKKYRKSIWTNKNINLLIDKAVMDLMPAIEANSNKWYPEDNLEDYLNEVEELKEFLNKRLDWMDDNIHLVKRITKDVDE